RAPVYLAAAQRRQRHRLLPHPQQSRGRARRPGRGVAADRCQTIWKWASVGLVLLIGRMSCGQAEKATITSISARISRWSPGLLTVGRKSMSPFALTGMFIQTLKGLGTSGGVRPSSAIAEWRLSEIGRAH